MTNKIKADFERLVGSEDLAHGYIFHGEDLSAQFNFALSLAHFLERGSWQVSERLLSDVRVIDQGVGVIGIDVVRDVQRFLYHQPSESSHRVVIVNNAGKLNHLAQNALLKIAEEPPRHGLLILSIKDAGALSPTLLSRFSKVYFPGAGGGEEHEGVREFLLAGKRDRSALIKEMVKNEKENPQIDGFVRGLIKELNKEPEKNYRALRELSHRYEAMNQFNTNKRLQLEAVLQYLD